jgi:hypothetical protein
MDGTSYADGRQFAVHENESKCGDLRNSVFSPKTQELQQQTEAATKTYENG